MLPENSCSVSLWKHFLANILRYENTSAGWLHNWLQTRSAFIFHSQTEADCAGIFELTFPALVSDKPEIIDKACRSPALQRAGCAAVQLALLQRSTVSVFLNHEENDPIQSLE